MNEFNTSSSLVFYVSVLLLSLYRSSFHRWYPSQVSEKSELNRSKSEVEKSQKQREFISEPNTKSQKRVKKQKEFISEKNTKTQKERESSSLSKVRLRYSNDFVYFL